LAIIQQPKWPSTVRAVVTFIACVIAGLITVAVAGDLNFSDPNQWITSVLFVLVTAVATYKGFWKPTNIAPKIEGTSSPSSGSPAPSASTTPDTPSPGTTLPGHGSTAPPDDTPDTAA